MSRKTIVRKQKKFNLEPKYKNAILSKFIRMLMWDGKLSLAEKIVYDALDAIEKKLEKPALEIFMETLTNIKPLVKVKARRVGGATYQVPIEVSNEAGYTIAMTWIISAARKKSGAAMQNKLAEELIAGYEKRGDAFKKREETHRMAEANRAYAHYRA